MLFAIARPVLPDDHASSCPVRPGALNAGVEAPGIIEAIGPNRLMPLIRPWVGEIDVTPEARS